MTNRLAAESSAYLQQHRDNPVDWYAWGDEPFERARRENKPVLVSIGYSSCHWCHVMERESFEDPATARVMNEHLICIKVDREERPDVDQVYMDALMRLSRSGGWPLNMFCTPDGRPFYGGTYFPPRPAHGRPSWSEVVVTVARAFRDQPDEVDKVAAQILESLAQRPDPGAAPRPGRETLFRFCTGLMQSADTAHGGFGGAPKFPTPTQLEAILAASRHRAATAGALEHVLFTLHRMARGGIYDQLGGGFHRYSTDARWLVPHFEKMLYDQGQLLRVYGEAFAISADPQLEWPVAETIAFLERELRGPEGGFYASLDADSEGEEGIFYVWTPEQVRDVLGPEDAEAFSAAYGVVRGGTFENSGASVLEHGLAGARPRFALARQRLLEARAARVRPNTDPKHVTAWIGYTIGGLATAGAAFERPDWVAAAEGAARFVAEHMVDPEGRLLRIWDGERARVPAFLDDHAALLTGLLDLHRAGGDERALRGALDVAQELRERFWDAAERALYFTAADGGALVHRPRSDHDGATPAAAGLAALGLVRIAGLTGRAELAEVAEAVIDREAPLLARQPLGFPTLLRAALLLEQGMGIGVVIGAPDAAETGALAARARRLLAADEAVVVLAPGERPDWLDPQWLEGRDPQGAPTAWLCRGRACSLPATDPEALELPAL